MADVSLVKENTALAMADFHWGMLLVESFPPQFATGPMPTIA